MDNTLSQEEVDALLQAVKSGDIVEESQAYKEDIEQVKVISYNFRKPQVISSDQNRGFQVIHESFAKGLQSSLLTNLKVPLEVMPVAIDYLTYTEFIMSIMSPTFMVVLTTEPYMGELLLEINLPIMICIIDILLGGDGGGMPVSRELTSIEECIVGSIVDYTLRELTMAWSDTADIAFHLQAVEYDPEYVRVTSLESSVLSATFDLRMGTKTGTMNICYPFEMIQPILDRVTAKMTGGRDRRGKRMGTKNEILTAIRNVPINLDASIGSCRITADQLSKLKVGDVIKLDKRIDQLADVHIENKHAFRATLGTRRGKLAVRLVDRYSEDMEEGSLVVDLD